jgi:hypothetical protein
MESGICGSNTPSRLWGQGGQHRASSSSPGPEPQSLKDVLSQHLEET